MNKHFRFQNLLNKLRIPQKLLLMYTCTSLIPIFVIGIYSSIDYKNLVIDRTNQEAISCINELSDNFSRLVEFNKFVTSTIYSDGILQNISSIEDLNYKEIIDLYNKSSISGNLLKYYKELKYINIYTENKNLLYSKYFTEADEKIKNQEWYIDVTQNNTSPKWYYKKNLNSNKYDLALITPILDNNKNLICVLDIGLRTEVLNNLLKNMNYDAFIDLDNNSIVVSNNNKIYREKSDSYKFKLKKTKDDIEIYDGFVNYKSIRLIKKNILQDISSLNDFNIYLAINLTDIIIETKFFSLDRISIIIVSLLFSGLLILGFTKIFNKRFSILSKEMSKVSHGEFNIPESIDGNDEISELYSDLVTMSDNLKNLINDIYIADLNKEKMVRHQKEIEFKMLCSQINPHFLYNTLETIRMKAYLNGDKECADLIKRLAKLMRSTLEVSSSLVTLESELDLINNYLTIQKYRFEDHISFNFDINCDVKNIMILPMLIQPIVENAFIHGLEKKIGSGFLDIKIYLEDIYLFISIKDNGLGISEDNLNHILKEFENEDCDSSRIGINNVYKRIKLFYDENCGIDVFSDENNTIFTLKLNAIIKGDLNFDKSTYNR